MRDLSEEIAAVSEVAAGCDADKLIEVVTRRCTALLAERGSCILLGDEADTALVVFSSHVPSLRNCPVTLSKYPELTLALANRSPVVVSDVRKDPRLEAVRARLPHELRSTIALPLPGSDGPAGALLFQSTKPTSPAPEALEAATTLAHLLGAFLAVGKTGFKPKHPEPRPSAPAVPPQGRVLVVEDDTTQALLLENLLADEGYVVRTVDHGSKVLAEVRASAPDLVVLDVGLPGEDGFQLGARLRSEPTTAEVPLLFLSGHQDLPVRVRSAPLDNIDFVSKPFTPEALITRIGRLIRVDRERRELRQAATRDELTGLANVRVLRARMGEPPSTPTSMVMLDLDLLKRINDRFGHDTGSALIASVGRILRAAVGPDEVAARYGGDEFVLLLPGCTEATAEARARQVLDEIRTLEVGDGRAAASIGVASMEPGLGLDEVLRRADVAAYDAKHQGGDRVTCFTPHAPPAAVATVSSQRR